MEDNFRQSAPGVRGKARGIVRRRIIRIALRMRLVRRVHLGRIEEDDDHWGSAVAWRRAGGNGSQSTLPPQTTGRGFASTFSLTIFVILPLQSAP